MCNCNNTPLCSNNDCSCPVKDLSTDCVLYTGADLACSGIKSQTILTDLILQLDTFICSLETQPTLNIINVGTGAGVYKGIVGSNRQLRSIKSPDNSVGVAVSSNGNEIHLTANSADLIDKISLSFDWKNNLITTTKTPEDLPVGITDSVYKRTGYIGFNKPILAGTVVEHPNVEHYDNILYPPILIEAQVYNLGVNIKNFDKIADLNPVLVISKYTHTKRRTNLDPEPIPGSTTGELFPEITFRKGGFKLSVDNDPVRLTRVPIQAKYQVIDFGQEHYFATNLTFQNEGVPLDTNEQKRLVKTRGNGFTHTSLTPVPGEDATIKIQYSKAFVYLQFHIEIDVAGEKILSKTLGRLKMILSVPAIAANTAEVLDPLLPGQTLLHDYLITNPGKPVTTIRYKHS